MYLIFCPEASVVHVFDNRQLQANPPVAGPRLTPRKSTRRAVATMGSNDLVVGEDYRVASGITGKRAGVARWPLAYYIGGRQLWFQTSAVLRSIPLWK